MRSAPGTAHRPLRVVMAGTSTTFLMVPARRNRDEATWAEWLPELLEQQGIVTRAEVVTRWHGTIVEFTADHERFVRDQFPDVVILDYGLVDAQPRAVPTWFYRNVMTWRPGSNRVARVYRDRAIPSLRRAVQAWEKALAARTPVRFSRTSPARYQAELQRFIRQSWNQNRPLILLAEIVPPSADYTARVPGTAERRQHFQAIARRVVARFDNPQIRIVPTNAAIDEVGADAALPDGIHRTADVHRRTAEILAREILASADYLGLTPEL